MASPSTIVLITGANSGVGYAASEVIANNEGYHVIMASRNEENGRKALEEIKASTAIEGTLSTVKLDVNDAASVKEAARQVEQTHGRIDVLINNAGIAPYGSSPEDFEQTFRTNVIGPYLVMDAFKHLLLKSKNAYSIYISSSLASLTQASDPGTPSYKAGWVVYRQSKAALNMWVVEEAKILSEQGVKTFAMCPGFVVSNLRGASEEQRSGGGRAGDPRVSGQTLLSIIQGTRDADAGRLVHKDGVYPW